MTPRKTTKAEARRAEEKRRWVEQEMAGRSLLDRWWGVEGITHFMGHPRFASDDSLERIARMYRRGLEDVRDGLARRAAPDLNDREVEANLRDVEDEQGRREALRYAWQASEDGTSSYDEFCQAGGLEMLAEASRAGQEPLIRPSYKLAMFMDWGRWLQGRLTCLDWSPVAPKGCYTSTWAREAWGREKAAYYALLDAS